MDLENAFNLIHELSVHECPRGIHTDYDCICFKNIKMVHFSICVIFNFLKHNLYTSRFTCDDKNFTLNPKYLNCKLFEKFVYLYYFFKFYRVKIVTDK